METAIQINTGNGQETFTTDVIKGELNSIILKSSEKVEVIMESELGYLLFQQREFVGTEYISLRSRARGPIWNLLDGTQFDKFMLNEKILITVIGPTNVKVDMIIRCS